MSPVFDSLLRGAAALDVLGANRASAATLAALQQQRLQGLLQAVADSPSLYARGLRGRHGRQAPLHSLPVFGKQELMRRFDEWVTDPRLRLAELQAFTADPARIGQPYLGQYTVWESSGSTGTPGMFVQDRQSMALYDALEALRRSPPSPARRWLDPLYLSERIAFVGAIDGHFASIVAMRRLQSISPWTSQVTRSLSVLRPLRALVDELQAFAPSILSTYPTVATALAEEQARGRLRLRLRELWTGGETLSTAARARITQVFACPLRNHYGASEFFSIASECALGQLHANTDWLILEPVDAQHRPAASVEDCSTTLLTHLGNRVQPLIRYDLGDQITLQPQPCPCGSPLPVIQVRGRNDPPLQLQGQQGELVRIVPLALISVLEDQAGLFDFRLRQRDARTVELAIAHTGAQAAQSLQRACAALQCFFAVQGLAPIRIEQRQGAKLVRGSSGKAARIVAA